MITRFEHQRATTVEQALAAVASGAVPYVGGTELLAAMKLGLTAPERLVDLKQVGELRGVRSDDDSITIGAATPHAEVAASLIVRERLPMLANVTSVIGNPRVRWQGTVGGNLCFAEPRSDLIPALIALRARLRLRSQEGGRGVDMESFVSAPFTVDRRDDELLVDVVIPTGDLLFQQYHRLQIMERPTVGVALVGAATGWRLCVGAAGYIPSWHDAPTPGGFDADAVADAIEPMEDAAGAADYKRDLVRTLVSRALSGARKVDS